MLTGSELGFTPDDVDMVLHAHDVNEDKLLVYREFVPIAVDLIQAQKAVVYADEVSMLTLLVFIFCSPIRPNLAAYIVPSTFKTR